MFTGSCYIRIESDEIHSYVVSELKKIRRKIYFSARKRRTNGLSARKTGDVIGVNAAGFGNQHDCGDNVPLFLALAALRDDSDYMQWFRYEDEWFLCDDEDIEQTRSECAHSCQSARLHQSHKATKDELIKHFQ